MGPTCGMVISRQCWTVDDGLVVAGVESDPILGNQALEIFFFCRWKLIIAGLFMEVFVLILFI